MMKDMPKTYLRQVSGQIGIIVVLITAAILTFGLSVANRVVQESKITIDRSDSVRVFNIAETGIDEALNQIYKFEVGDLAQEPSGVILSEDDRQVKITLESEIEASLIQGENLRIDLNNGVTGNINIKWSKSVCSSSNRVGLLLTLLHLNGNEYQSFYYLIGGNNDECFFENAQNFIRVTENGASEYKYSYPLNVNPALTNASLYIQAVGANTDIQVGGSANLIKNAQYDIESLARNEDDTSNKAINVTKTIPSAPGFMTFALFSGGTIVK